jgi:hypothetical protein
MQARPEDIILNSQRWQMEGAWAWTYETTIRGGQIQNLPAQNYPYTEREYIYFRDMNGNRVSISVNKDPLTGEYDVERFHYSSDKFQSEPWKSYNR